MVIIRKSRENAKKHIIIIFTTIETLNRKNKLLFIFFANVVFLFTQIWLECKISLFTQQSKLWTNIGDLELSQTLLSHLFDLGFSLIY